MLRFAKFVDRSVTTFTDAQGAAYDLAHELRSSYIGDWKIEISEKNRGDDRGGQITKDDP